MTFTNKLSSVEEAKLLSERIEQRNQLKARLKQTRDKLIAAGTTGAEKLELQEQLVGIETEMAAFNAETGGDTVDPHKVVEEANAHNQNKIDKRRAKEDAQKDALAEMQRKDVSGVAY